jgi:competence protein ComEC
MEKTNAHWRAAHPLVFISGYLCIGVLIAEAITANHIANGKNIGLIILGTSIPLLFSATILKISNTTKSIAHTACLVSWGFAIFLLTSNGNIFKIAYPVYFIEQCRNVVVLKINHTITNAEANGFAQALLLGVKININKELLTAYNQLGIIHIIAISGMHLEIIFKNLTRVTKWLPRKKYFLLLELIIVLLGVWTYALMAFASPSIVRASIFFSIYFIGKYFNQSVFVLNFIAAGVLTVLLFDIKHLHHIGLQLSYAAVIGIRLFYPIFNKMLPMQNPLLAFLWSNFSVTLSAQLTTFPILAYQFHQVSTMVLLSNFVMVPLSNVLLYGLAFLILVPNWYGLAGYLGYLMERYILFINWIIHYASTKSIAKMASVAISKYIVIAYYICLFLFYLWLFYKKVNYLKYAIWLMSLLFIIKLFSKS